MAWESFIIYKNIIINHYHKLQTTQKTKQLKDQNCQE